MNNLREIGPALDSAAFKKLQELCGHKPPPDYAKFLQKTNGGKFEGFQYVAVPGGDTVAVDALAGLGEGTLHDALTWFKDMNMGEEDVPPGYIPVAFTPGGDPFVISMVDEVQGVYFWDEPQFFKKSRKKAHAYFVAPTFSQFLKLLRPTLEEAEADLAACDSSVKPVGLVKPPKVKVIRPKFKGKLDAKLDQASLHFPELFHSGKCSDPRSARNSGFELTASVDDDWGEFVESLITQIESYPAVMQCVDANANAMLLYFFLYGFVTGQYHKGRVKDDEFMYSKRNISDALVRNLGLVPS